MAYTVNRGSNFSGLTIADDRSAAFETIRESNDWLMRDRRAKDKPLTNEDYFGTLPAQTNQMLHHKRLHALVEQTERIRTQDHRTAENERQEAYKVSF